MASAKVLPPPLPGHVGPFPPGVKPVNGPGMFKRVSPKTGELVWAYWDGRQWGKFSSDFDRAAHKAHKRSRRQLWWYGKAKE